MRLASAVCGLIGGLALAQPASAAMVVVYANPETLERHTIVVDPNGPDRMYRCMLLPAQTGCHWIPSRRR